MTVIRVHELAKKMGIESKDIITILDRMGISGKTATSGLDDKEAKSLIERLKAARKDKDTQKKDRGGGEPVASKEERLKKAASLVGKFSGTLEKPGAKPRPIPPRGIMPPVIPPPPAATAPVTEPPRTAAEQPAPPPAERRPAPAVQTQTIADRMQRPGRRPAFNAPVFPSAPPAAPPAPGKPSRKKKGKKGAEAARSDDRDFREKPLFKKLPDLQTLPMGRKPHRKEDRHAQHTDLAEITKPRKKVVKIQEGGTIKDFAELMGQKVGDVIKRLMGMGIMATQNQPMDMDAAMLMAEGYGIKAEVATLETAEDILEDKDVETEEQKVPRPPVVTIMGHVDHGKTSLLDAIRQANVVAGEAGGITQHIGAYQVSLKGRDITFLDTPGHEAFTAMRARGAQVTDVVVLVVAADDGVMPQTREAVNHAKAANVPIIVAVNKIDKPEAKPDRVKQELSDLGLIPESWGGQTIFCEVSAKKKIGIEQLLEMILIQADVLELKANADKMARGTIIEAKLDRGRGPVATVLVQSGTLRAGDVFVSGLQFGRVRALINDKGERIEAAGPAVPAEVIGFSGVPQAGDTFVVVEEERKARQVAEFRMNKQRTAMSGLKKVSLEDLHSQIQEGTVKELNVVLKADVQGSAGAIVDALEKLSTPAVKLRVIHSSVGAVNETDVMLAAASNAVIIAFSVRPEPKATELAQREGVDIRSYNIIYNIIDDIKAAMEGLLEPTIKEKVLGRAEVRQTFHVSKVGTIAGCYVLDGVMTRQNDGVRLLRDNVVIFEGKLHSLRRFKDDVREVQAGYECGIGIENFNDVKVGDVIEAFALEKIAAKL